MTGLPKTDENQRQRHGKQEKLVEPLERDLMIVGGTSSLYLMATQSLSMALGGGSNVASQYTFPAQLDAWLEVFLIMLAAVVLCHVAFRKGMVGLGRLSAAIGAFASSAVFCLGFMTFKRTMPDILPFFADPLWAEIDRLLHFGWEPWVLAHQLARCVFGAGPDAQVVSALYVNFWGAMIWLFPVVLWFFDDDHERRRRFTALYAVVWIVIGNVLALIGLSGGPVFNDRLTGGHEFAALTDMLKESGISVSLTGQVQDFLWTNFVNGDQSLGSGISAFPSVHVGLAALVAIYAAERHVLLAVPGFAFLAVILFLSVYLGWHYAIDGYVSILVLVAANRMLVGRMSPSGQASGPPPC